MYSAANHGVIMESTKWEEYPNIKVSPNNKEASSKEEADTASHSSKDDGSDDEDCGNKDYVGQTSDNDDIESSLMKMISEFLKSETKK